MKSYTLLSTLAACAMAQMPMKAPGAAIMINAKPAPAGAQKIQTVIVGGFAPAATAGGQPTPQMQFMPESIVAQPGDTVRFMFMGMNHSVVQTSFQTPCKPVANGFNTGFKPNAQNQLVGAPTMDLPIKDTKPLFMSSLEVASCGAGMVFVVNPPPNETLVQFKQAAMKEGAPNLKNAQIVAAQPVPQVASTVAIRPQGVGAAQATPGAPGAPQGSVVPGQGTTGAGQACGCQCLCGAGSFPANAGQGAFGGVLGAMPDGAVPAGGMLPAGGMMPPAPVPAGGNATAQVAPTPAGAAIQISPAAGPPPARAVQTPKVRRS